MTTTKARVLKVVAALVAGISLCASAKAQSEIVYNNTSTPNFEASYYSPFEFGDEVNLQGVGRKLVEFSFEYFGDLTPAAGKFALLSIYDNTGAGGAPGNLIFQTDAIELLSGYQGVTISGIPELNLPDTITWTLTPVGLNSTEKASLLIYDNPSVGSSPNDFWQKNALGGWSRQVLNNQNGQAIANFGAKITVVPEPSTTVLMIAGAGYLLFLGYRRRVAA